MISTACPSSVAADFREELTGQEQRGMDTYAIEDVPSEDWSPVFWRKFPNWEAELHRYEQFVLDNPGCEFSDLSGPAQKAPGHRRGHPSTATRALSGGGTSAPAGSGPGLGATSAGLPRPAAPGRPA